MKYIHILGCCVWGVLVGICMLYYFWNTQLPIPKVNLHNTQSKQEYAFCKIPAYSVVLWSALDTPQDLCSTKYSLVYIWIRSLKGEEYILNGVRSLFLQCRVLIFWDSGYDTIHPELLQPWKEIIFPIVVDKNYHIINTPYDDINLITPEWQEKREEFLQEHYQFLQTLPECEPNIQ